MGESLVVNTSPIVFLGNAGHLELLRIMTPGRVIVPEPVHQEVSAGGHEDAAARALTSAIWIERGPAVAVPPAVTEWDLGAGESSVIATALSIDKPIVVIDDLAGRRCALSFGLRLRGTLGVVVEAQRRGAIPSARDVLLELRARGMWLSDAVIERALELASL
jgi:predicted nucleic acid-binding protein